MTDPINDKVTVSAPEPGATLSKQTSKFEDLMSAGRLLATHFKNYSSTNTVVLAIARGGVPVALEVARHLAVPLDIILIRRLLANGPVSQICAVNVGGNLIIDQGLTLPSNSPKTPFEYFVIDALAGLAQREHSCRRSRPALEVKGKNVLVIDNGIHTGSTVLAAVRALRKMNPSSLIVGVPVAAQSTRRIVESAVDELICLKWPEPFGHVGLWYTKFDVPNEEQIREVLGGQFLAMNNQPTEAGFSKQLNTLFRVNVAPKPIELKLVEVKGFASGANDPPNMERFSLFFNGPADFYLPQGTYELQHEQMGKLEIFLVTIGQDEGRFRYEAVFNYFK